VARARVVQRPLAARDRRGFVDTAQTASTPVEVGDRSIAVLLRKKRSKPRAPRAGT
jgi:hypothetical protein